MRDDLRDDSAGRQWTPHLSIHKEEEKEAGERSVGAN